MSIEVKNDGKGKYQSFEAVFRPTTTPSNGRSFATDWEVTAWGETRGEAIANLYIAMCAFVKDASDGLKEVTDSFDKEIGQKTSSE